jgi:Transglycosylase SLT domain
MRNSGRKILSGAVTTVVVVVGLTATVNAQLLGGDGGPLNGVTGGHGGGGNGGLLDGVTGGGGGGNGGPLDGVTGGGGGGGLLDGVTGGGGDGGLVPETPDVTPPPPGGGDTGNGDGTAGPTGDGGRGGGHRDGGSGGSGSSGGHQSAEERHEQFRPPPTPSRKPSGAPTIDNPGLTLAPSGAAPIGVPNFVIDQFEIPPFLLPIYQACGTQYDIPWQVLAGINKIETGFGTNLNISTAGAMGWMQFIPSTWQMYGVDANGDGKKDPYNPVDAICAAARYLNAAGGAEDIRTAIFAYNHADWYVDEVLLYAKQYGSLPSDLVDSLTGLTAGDRFPVAAEARYADDVKERRDAHRAEGKGDSIGSNLPTSPTKNGINIYADKGSPVVAVNDGTIKRIGHDEHRGNYLVLEDSYGNRFTYAELGAISRVHPVATHKRLTDKDFQLVKGDDPTPQAPATRGLAKGTKATDETVSSEDSGTGTPVSTETRRRIFAYPNRTDGVHRSDLMGKIDTPGALSGFATFNPLAGEVKKLHSHSMGVKPLREGSRVTAGTILGRIGEDSDGAPHLNFSIRPVGTGAPKINPKPILDGWKLLEATAIYRAQGKNPFEQNTTGNVTQDLLLSKTQLEHKTLADPRLSIYECGRQDIQTGQIDRRLLAAMEYLVDNGFRLTITSLKCGHGVMTSSGNVSEHTTGGAMDIAVVDGIPITGHQGPGSITEQVIQTLLRLQGPMEPHQIISLMNLGGPSFSMADHYDHIHVGYAPTAAAETDKKGQLAALLKPDQWRQLVGRIAEIDNPTVKPAPSRFAVPAQQPKRDRASHAHKGD